MGRLAELAQGQEPGGIEGRRQAELDGELPIDRRVAGPLEANVAARSEQDEGPHDRRHTQDHGPHPGRQPGTVIERHDADPVRAQERQADHARHQMGPRGQPEQRSGCDGLPPGEAPIPRLAPKGPHGQ